MPRHRLHLGRARGHATWKRLSRIAGVLIMGGLLQAAATDASANVDSSASTGRRMFFGESSLQGAIAGHAEPLPPRMVSCVNCHMGAAGLGSAASFAPSLGRSRMTEPLGRRGGPPSLFSQASFCRMLRTGVDPAYILITRRMPRYTLSDDQCLGLWRFLTESSDAPGAE